MKNLMIAFIALFLGLNSCTKNDPIVITGGIGGIVTNKNTGEPVSGVNLTLSPGGLSKTSGSDGRYEFQNIEAQQYDIQAQMPGFKYNVKSTVVIAGQTAKCDIPIEPSK